MAVQVVDRDERQAGAPGEPLRSGETDEERTDQAGAAGDADDLDLREGRSGLLERLAHDRRNEL
jgi:hypothetical protein